MSNTPHMLPCPFCGGKAIHRWESLGEYCAYADRVSLTCDSCGVVVSALGDTSKPGYADNSTIEARAISAWNRRAPQPVVREPLTANQAQELIELESWGVDAITLNAQLMRTIRRTEAAHGIKQKGGKDAE